MNTRTLAAALLLALLLAPAAASSQAAGTAGGIAADTADDTPGPGGSAGLALERTLPTDERVRLAVQVAATGQLAYARNTTLVLLDDPLADDLVREVIPVSDARLTALAVFPGEERLAWGDAAGRVGTLDLATGAVNATPHHQAPVTALAMLPHGLVASASHDATVALWDAELALERTLTVSGAVTALAVSPAGDRLAVGGLGAEIQLYNTSDWSVARTLPRDAGWVTALAFIPSGPLAGSLAVADSSGLLNLYTDPGEKILAVDLGAWANDLLWWPPAGYLVAAGQDGNLSLLAPGVGELVAVGRLAAGSALYALAALGDGALVAGGSDGLVLLSPDRDGDGVGDPRDPFPADETQWADSDDDGFGDNPRGRDPDAFPSDPAASRDSDGDGYPDAWNAEQSEADSTLGLARDAFPRDPREWADSDGDGVGDNRDPWPHNRFITSSGQVQAAQLVAATVVALMLLHLLLTGTARYRLRRFARRLADPHPNLAPHVAAATAALAGVRKLLGRGRCLAARRALARTHRAYAGQERLHRQADGEIVEARRALALCHAEGLEPSTRLRDRTRAAMGAGDFARARDLARRARRDFNAQLARAARTAAGFGKTLPTAAVPAAADTGIPGYDWHGRTAPAASRDAPNVINISFSDCVINRSELKLADANAAAGGDTTVMNRRSVSAGGRAHEA